MSVHMNGWLALAARRVQAQRLHEGEDLYSSRAVARKMRELRKKYLGSDISLEALVVGRDGKPDVAAVKELTEYLCKQAVIYRRVESRTGEAETYAAFFYFSLYLFALQSIGDESVDDLIQLGDCYEKDPYVFMYVCEMDLTDDLYCEVESWVMENEYAPAGFSEGVLAAVCALLGVLPDYTGEMIWEEEDL